MPQPANILFITSDQQHWGELGFLNPEVRTPNLDRLARRGTCFSRAYTVNPTCTPTRCSWISGTYPSQHGAYSLGTKMFEDVPTVNDVFRKANFRTALIGKAHFQPLMATPEYPSLESYPLLHDLDFWREYKGPFYGFDTFELARNHVDEPHVGQHYALWMESKGCKNWRDYFLPNYYTPPGDKFPDSKHIQRKPGEAWDIPEELHYNAWIAERTNAVMDDFKADDKPFFLWASFFDPHPVYMVPEPYASMYDPAKVTVPEHTPGEFDDKPPHFAMTQQPGADFSAYYNEPNNDGHHLHGAGCHLKSREEKAKNIAMMYGMMTMLDTYIGKILDHLEEQGLADDTLVVFTSDHGDFWGQHGLTAKCLHHYEDLVRVPLIAALPGQIPAGKTCADLQSTVDLAPTFLSFAGLPVPRWMTGLDRKANWEGDASCARRHVMVENHHNPTKFHIETLVNARYKITVYRDADHGELYDLEADPGELVNLWDHPDRLALKQKMLLEFCQARMEAQPMPMPRIAGA